MHDRLFTPDRCVRNCCSILVFLFLCTFLSDPSFATPLTPPSQNPPDPHAVPSLDGGAGPCTADFTINDSSGKPVYAAKINVHIAYGTWNVRKLDLEIGTNTDGKARLTGLPSRIKHGILFHASEGDRVGEAFDDPANTCKAQFTITIRKPLTP